MNRIDDEKINCFRQMELDLVSPSTIPQLLCYKLKNKSAVENSRFVNC
jgi:hypothetical protein